MRITINEREIINSALNEGVIDNKTSKTIFPLIKHYLDIGFSKKEVFIEIDSFLSKNYKNYKKDKWEDVLIGWINSQSKKDCTILEIKEISITKSEIEFIHKLNNKVFEKLAFVYLVYSKIYNIKNKTDLYWVNSSRRDIFEDAKITASVQKQCYMVNDLIALGVIENSYSNTKGSKRVCFASDSDEVVLTITDFRNYVYEYLKWCGEEYIECDSCSILTSLTSNNKKYCQPCWKEKQKEWQRESMRKLRENRKCEVIG